MLHRTAHVLINPRTLIFHLPHFTARTPGLHSSTSGEAVMKPCRFFAEGRCSRHDCPFWHDPKAILNSPGTTKFDQLGREGSSNFSSEVLDNGKTLRPNAAVFQPTGSGQAMPLQSRSKIPCKFFARGFCRTGTTCNFQHEGPFTTSPTEAHVPDDVLRAQQHDVTMPPTC
jgi:hypothetical protein